MTAEHEARLGLDYMPIDSIVLPDGPGIPLDFEGGGGPSGYDPSLIVLTPMVAGGQWFDGRQMHSVTWEWATGGGRFVTTRPKELVE